MIKVTAQQRANLLEALHVMWPSVPPENVAKDLRFWLRDSRRKRPGCKTIACFGGWCALWPSFVAQGVRPGPLGSPTDDTGAFPSRISERLFGESSLFADRKGWTDEGPLSDHEVVTFRLQFLLLNSEVE